MKIHVNKKAIGCSIVAALTSVGAYSQNLPARPNILVILTDQQSYESMSFNIGNKYLNTPNMDQLAKTGVSFTNAYSANPLCVPSRSSMITGRYPFEINMQWNQDNNLLDPVEFPTYGTVFAKSGYETGYTGKWHVPYDTGKPETHGFQFMDNIRNDGGDSQIAGSMETFLKDRKDKPFLFVASFCNPHNICQYVEGHKFHDGEVGTPPPPSERPPLRPNHGFSKNETDIMKREFMAWKPFQESKKYPLISEFSDDKWREFTWTYYRMIEKVDGEIGKLLTVLRESGLDKNTIIIFTADHGDCQGAHRRFQKIVFFEEAVKVPFIVSYPGVKPAKSDFLVQTGIDLMPTLCDFAGIQPGKKFPGTSLKKIVTTDSSPTEREYVVVSDQLALTAALIKPETEGRMLRNERFKYWVYGEGKQTETLYDLKNDPGEMVNLAGDRKYKKDLEICRKQMAEYAAKYNDPFLKNMFRNEQKY